MKDKKKMVLIMSTILGVILIIGTSYAYFTVTVIGNDLTNDTVVTSAVLKATYSEGTSTLEASSILPGWSGEKEVTITSDNETTSAINYALRWKILETTFLEDTDLNSNSVCNLVYSVTKDNIEVKNGTLCSDNNSDKQGDIIISGRLLHANDSDTYKIRVEFINQNYSQDLNKGSSISLKINAEEVSTISGTIYDMNNEPIRNQAFAMYSTPTYFVTDSNGHYEVAAEKGNHNIYFIQDMSIPELRALGESIKTNPEVETVEINTVNTSDIIFGNYQRKIIIKYNATGGTVNPTSIDITGIGSITNLPTPTKNISGKNILFKGWYTDPNEGTEITSSTLFDKSTTIYAQWDNNICVYSKISANGKWQGDYACNNGTATINKCTNISKGVVCTDGGFDRRDPVYSCIYNNTSGWIVMKNSCNSTYDGIEWGGALPSSESCSCS